jgi:hypothetical protein
MRHGKRHRNSHQSARPQTPGGSVPQGFASGGPAPGHRPAHHSEQHFGREPFTNVSEPRYFGTGVPGYVSGPGYTGGVYGYGEESPDIPTELESEYAYDVYGYGSGAYQPDLGRPPYWSGSRRPSERQYRLRQRKYPPGPKGYVRSDARIHEDLCDRIAAANHIDSSDVTVEVAGGKVVLQGTVPERRMKHAIEDMADACAGVQEIENRIRVQPA